MCFGGGKDWNPEIKVSNPNSSGHTEEKKLTPVHETLIKSY